VLGPARAAARLPRIPAGDLVVVFEAAWAAAAGAARDLAATTSRVADAVRARWPHLHLPHDRLARIELALTAGPTVGALMLVLVAALAIAFMLA
jgi:hypothetical protein